MRECRHRNDETRTVENAASSKKGLRRSVPVAERVPSSPPLWRTEFRFGNAEIGHVHAGGIVDMSFPRSVRDALIEEGLAEEHRWVPNSGWIPFRVHSEQDVGPCAVAHATLVPALRARGSNRPAKAIRARE